MAITKNTTYDMEIVDDYYIQVRENNTYVENGEILSSKFVRHTIQPNDDWSSEPQKVKNFCDALFTDAIKTEYDAWILANEPQPYPSWTMKSGKWTPPVAKPDDGKDYEWNEETQAWDEI